jgi:hypothetical protein
MKENLLKPYWSANLSADPAICSRTRHRNEVMNLVYKHGQRYGLIPRDASANPMNWVSQKTTSNYAAVIMNPRQAFEILLNIPEPRRTLVLQMRRQPCEYRRFSVGCGWIWTSRIR